MAGFYARYGHFLDTNGPYRLDSWSPHRVVLQVFRDASYPEGVGSLDRYAIPLRAYVSTIEDRGDRLEIRADVERVSRFQRSYEIERVSPGPAQRGADDDNPSQCRYVIVAPNGKMLRAGGGSVGSDGRFTLPLRELRHPGAYKIMIALYVGGNSVNPEVRVVEHRVDGASAPQRGRHSSEGVRGASR